MSSSATPLHDAGNRLLLHVCCGPCALEPTRIFAQEGTSFAVHYANSNIHPAAEYEHRLSTLAEHVCGSRGIELIEAPYDPEEWERKVAVFGTDRERRCRACYRLRFEQTAREAAARSFTAISTTLTISPYQFTDVIIEELEGAAARHGLVADARDFSDRYQDATRISREKGMYRQNYCGCRFSIAEAEAQRAATKKRQAHERHLRHVALLTMAAEGVYTQNSEV